MDFWASKVTLFRKSEGRLLLWYYPCLIFSMSKKRKSSKQKWSAEVTKHSNALDLKKGVFTLHDPKKIAESLKSSAKHSHRRKGTPYQSAMSMLNFYINRSGKNLPENQKDILEKAKDELRKVFGREKEDEGKK
jgi:putative cell wall-binding protein